MVTATPRPRDPNGDTSVRARLRFVVAATLVVIGLVALAVAMWMLRDILLLVFGAVLLAVLLRTSAAELERWTPLGPKLALVVVLIALTALIGVVGYFFGAQLNAELRSLWERLPTAAESLRDRFNIELSLNEMAEQLGEMIRERGDTLLSRIGTILFGAAAVVLNIVIIVVGGIYFAAQPDLYRKGLARLLSPLGQERAERLLDESQSSLRRWLLGQLMSMAFVAVATTGVLMALGVPSALALGLFAGAVEFVPIVGPIVAAIPAVLIASGESVTLALWVAAAFFMIQQIESNVVLPLVQREMVSLPPAVTVFSLLAFGVLLGPMGVVFAVPLTVVIFALAHELYPTPTDPAGGPRTPETSADDATRLAGTRKRLAG
jgi:predicted PurR-regulated permease PerM